MRPTIGTLVKVTSDCIGINYEEEYMFIGLLDEWLQEKARKAGKKPKRKPPRKKGYYKI